MSDEPKDKEQDSPQYDIPEIQDWDEVLQNMPKLAPVLIGTEQDPVLRMSQLMAALGASKTSKTQLITNLAISMAIGADWLGMPCRKGRVLYLNFEVDGAEFDGRIKEMTSKLDLSEKQQEDLKKNLHVLNLRGNIVLTAGLKVLVECTAEKIANKAALARVDDVRGFYSAIIADPFYMCFNGDENNSGDVKEALRYFLELIEATGAALIYVHHHAKGPKGAMDSIDRGAGSGVHGRMPDSILDITVLDIGEKALKLLTDFYNDSNAVPMRMSFNTRGSRPRKPLNIVYSHPFHYEAPEQLGLDLLKEKGKDRQGQRKREQNEELWSIRNKIAAECLSELPPNCDKWDLYEAMALKLDDMPTPDTFKTWFKTPRFNYQAPKETLTWTERVTDKKGNTKEVTKNKTYYPVRPRDDSGQGEESQ